MLRGYAITFLIIHGYTLYFRHIAGHLGADFESFLAGAVTLALVIPGALPQKQPADALTR